MLVKAEKKIIHKKSYNKTVIVLNFGRHEDLSSLKIGDIQYHFLG